MSSLVDENTQKAIEIILEITKLSEQALLGVLRFVNESLENEKNKDNLFFSNETTAGKQKIQDLIKKHENNVFALDENLTKEQLKDYEKEFKKLGIDFSITKNSEDNYSFFFAGQQANLIEKALKNVVELKSSVLENENIQNAEKELNSLKENMNQETVSKIKNLYDEIFEIKEQKNELNEKLKENNSELNEKMEFLDKELSSKENTSQNEIDSIKEKKNELNEKLKESNNELHKKIEILDSTLEEKIKNLSPEEVKLLDKFENVAGLKSKVQSSIKKNNNVSFSMKNVKEIKQKLDKEQVNKVKEKQKKKEQEHSM